MATQDAQALKAAENGEKYFVVQISGSSPLIQPEFHARLNEVCADGYWQFHSVTQTPHGNEWFTLIVFDRTEKILKRRTMGFHS